MTLAPAASLSTVFRLRAVLEARADRGASMSLNQLAGAAGLAYNTVHAIYHNKTRRVDLDTLDALASVLGCLPGDLVSVAPAAPKPKRGRG